MNENIELLDSTKIDKSPKPEPIVVCHEPKCPKCQTRVEKLGDYCTKHHEEQVGQLKNYVGEHGLDVVLDILKKHFMLSLKESRHSLSK